MVFGIVVGSVVVLSIVGAQVAPWVKKNLPGWLAPRKAG